MKLRIIQLVAIGHIILGLALPLLMQIDMFSSLMISQIFPNLQLSEPVYNQASYLIGVFGPTVANWGVLLLILSNRYFANPTLKKWLGYFLPS